MSRLKATFSRLKSQNEAAFVPFVTCGDPNLQTTRELALAYIEAGADVLEIGIPFTDPLADGPTIQRASERALAARITMDDAFQLISDLRAQTEVPLVPMTYINPVWQIGLEPFAKRCREVGVDGVIISDLPPEEADNWVQAARKWEIDTVFLLAPTSDDARIEKVAEFASGFIYAVARLGVTGARTDVPPEIGELVSRLKKVSQTPVCAGFGFSDAAQIRQTVAQTGVDGIVVASALIDRWEKTGDVSLVADYARELKAATRR